MKKQSDVMTEDDIIKSLRQSYIESQKEYLEAQYKIDQGSELVNRAIQCAARHGKSHGVYIDKQAKATQIAFLAGMIAGVELVLNDIENIESVMNEEI